MKLYGRLQVIAPLLTAAVRDPGRTLRLLSLARLKNLYVTLYRQPAEMQESIVNFYLTIYRSGQPSGDLGDYGEAPELPLVFPEPSANPLVSIIVPVFNQAQMTLRCLSSVLRGTEAADFEVIVADDASTDETREMSRSLRNVRLTVNAERKGFVENCRRASSVAQGHWIVFLNNDTLVLPGWLDRMLEVGGTDSSIGMIGAKLLYPNGSLQEAGGIVWNDGSAWNYGRGGDPERPEYNYLREVDYVSGACLCIRRDLWQRLGGFDVRYAPAYYEDTDLAFSARSLGYKVIYQPLAEVVHFEGMSHGKDENVGVKRFQEENRKTFAVKWSSQLARDHLAPGRSLPLAREVDKRQKTILLIDHHVPFYDRDAGSRSTFLYIKWFLESGLRVRFIDDSFLNHEPYTRALQQMGVEVLYGSYHADHWVDWIRENGTYLDYVYLHRPHIARKYIGTVRRHCRGKTLYFGHDLHYLRAQRRAALDSQPRVRKEVEEWREAEFEVFRQSEVIYFPSAIETAEVKRHFPEKVVRTIPLYPSEGVEPLPDDFEARSGLLFVASFGHPPNLDGYHWFVREIFPRVRSVMPQCRLRVIGSAMPARLRLARNSGIRLHWNLSDTDLAKAYEKSRLAVVPLRYGAGIKGKILEAMQHQVPVVTTPIGAEGIADAESFLAIASNPEEFVDRLVRLYRDRDLWQRSREQGRIQFNRHFSKAKAREILGQDIELGERRERA